MEKQKKLPTFVTGEINMPAAAPWAGPLGRSPDSHLVVTIYLASARLRVRLAEGGPYPKPGFPFPFRVEVGMTSEITGHEAVPLFVTAALCADKRDSLCRDPAQSRVWGFFQGMVSVPAEGATAAEIRIPAIRLERLEKPVDAAACGRSGHAITGTLLPDRRIAAGPPGSTMLLIASPTPFPPVAEGSAPPVKQPFGIWAEVAPVEGKATRFSLAVPEGLRDRHFLLRLRKCNVGQPAGECAEKFRVASLLLTTASGEPVSCGSAPEEHFPLIGGRK